MDLLDAAYDLLRTANRPLTAREMVDSILKNGQWKTNGKTPDATLGARIYVDIKKHGALSRFVKVGKGLFALSGVEPEESAQVKKCAPDDVGSDGRKCLRTRKQTFSFTDCAEKVLRGQGNHTPMHYLEITSIALKNGWLVTSGKRPEATMYAQIILEIQRLRKRGEVPRFVQCGHGRVALSAWDKAGVDFQIQQHRYDDDNW